MGRLAIAVLDGAGLACAPYRTEIVDSMGTVLASAHLEHGIGFVAVTFPSAGEYAVHLYPASP